ncbi:hypothetical protein GWI33_000377 [Rhynchophorus ferrugineus]|uniref:Uncharacterized protein n=1 Tax=Rhynchophorus ferrugineus TaxID=354439 RepID=A0A834IT94_RHYFE|nr:hypothetical protein GWI33_000377 [Rhynchophorus ferrugineus]
MSEDLVLRRRRASFRKPTRSESNPFYSNKSQSDFLATNADHCEISKTSAPRARVDLRPPTLSLRELISDGQKRSIAAWPVPHKLAAIAGEFACHVNDRSANRIWESVRSGGRCDVTRAVGTTFFRSSPVDEAHTG